MSPNRPPRLEGFSYVGRYQYFLTICTDRRRAVFKKREAALWVTSHIQQFFEPKQFAVISYCVMPDHVHLLLEGATDGADFKAVVHDWKVKTGYEWKRRTGQRLWQEGFYDHVLREEESVRSVVRYILDNPIRAGLS